MANRTRRLPDYFIDLVIAWRSLEDMSYAECVERIVKLFGAEKRVTPQNLNIRVKRRLAKLERGEVPLKVKNPNDLTNEELLDWFKALMYYQVYSAQAKNDSKSLRQNIETSIKIMRAKVDLAGGTEEEELSAMDKLLKELRGEEEAVVN
jgi:TusA-related sulfurtransferase